jgi:hypothetical protein
MQMAGTVTQLCMIYRAGDGAIVHNHFEAFAHGMSLHTEQRMEILARRHASAAGHDLTDVRFLHLRDPRFAGWPKRVDPQTGKIELADFPHRRAPINRK